MFKDTLKNKYNNFGSIDDVVAKSKELDMAPRLYTVLRAYDLLDNYMALKVKPLIIKAFYVIIRQPDNLYRTKWLRNYIS